MYLYNTHYSNTTDTTRPQLKIDGNNVYATIHNQAPGSKSMPWFEVRGGKIYPTVHNPAGHDLHPWYEIRGDKVFQTMNHPEGQSHVAAYTMKRF